MGWVGLGVETDRISVSVTVPKLANDEVSVMAESISIVLVPVSVTAVTARVVPASADTNFAIIVQISQHYVRMRLELETIVRYAVSL
jgi:NaMN:DMB phosphoribosyltransferase